MHSIIVTGVNGFVGKHLALNLARHNIRVIGVGREKNLDKSIQNAVDEYIECDLTDPKAVAGIPLDGVLSIINLAGIAQVGNSFNNPQHYNEVNVKVQTTIAERILRENRNNIRILAISTGAIYDSGQKMPLDESSRLISEGSPYALSKIAMEFALKKYIDRGIDIIIARPFNHTGPGQLPGFLIPDLATQVLKNGYARTGDLTTARDYTDVRDVVDAYRLLSVKPRSYIKHTLYNVCSGDSKQGNEIFNSLKKHLGVNNAYTVLDKKLLRPNDPKNIVGNNARLVSDTGWVKNYSLDDTIKDYVIWAKEL